MSMRRPFFLSTLGGLLLAAGLASGDELTDARQQRFGERDRNRDGYLSLEEYAGHPGNFRSLDRDGDQRLSRTEFVYRGGRVPDDGKINTIDRAPSEAEIEQFERMDRNDDGIVSRGEWVGDTATFNRLDRTNDGRVTRDEFRSPLPADTAEGRHQGRDRNNDGVLSRSEWTDEPMAFEAADRNRDGQVTLDEYRDLPVLDERRFTDLDSDNDGVIVRREWPHAELRAFDGVDRNGDGAVTRREFLADTDPGNDVAVPRQSQFQDHDSNRDGYLTRREWPVDRDTFTWLDDNRDGRLTRAEFRDRERLWERFQRLDRDGDGVVSRREWPGSTPTFRMFDRDNDGVLSRNEVG
jgi:Ca2+-binding EF-hand superfamily protein